MKFFEEGIYVSPTSRCNAGCRHCVAQDDQPELSDVKRSEIMDWIDQIAEIGIKSIRFVGGEPFLVLPDLQVYVKRIKELGMESTVVTNASWARTKVNAHKVLETLPDLNNLIISSDRFHLEYIAADTVKNAIEAGLEHKKNVIMNVTYIEKSDIEHMNSLFGAYTDRIFIQVVKTMPFDGPEAEKIVKHCYFQKPTRTPKFCWIGNYFINTNGDVYACCQASQGLETNYLTLGNLNKERLKNLINKIQKEDVFQFIGNNGPRGIVEVFKESPYRDELMSIEFASGCEVCQQLLNNPEKYDYFVKHI